jgi:type I restriction enzyme S subunit
VSVFPESRVDRVATVKARIGWKALTAAEYQTEGYVFLATPNIKGNSIDFENVNYISEFRYEESPELKLRVGDVLLVKDGNTLGITNLVSEVPRPATVNGSIAVIRPHAVDGRFLRYALASDFVQGPIAAYRAGMGVPHLFQWDINRLRIPRPSRTTQRNVADYLDAETARIDALIERKRRLASRLQERAQAEQGLLASGRAAIGPLRSSGHAWLGDIPVGWPVVRLKHYARVESGHTPSRTNPELWEDCTIPWVTLNDVGYLKSHEWIAQTVNLISEAGIAASSARVLPAGTVVLSRDATVGRCGILAQPMATSQHFVDWICGSQLRPRYLWLLLTTVMQEHFASLTDGATLRTIGMSDIGEIVVPLPTLDEQDAIVKQAEEVRRRANRASDALAAQVELLLEHRQALITAAVTGGLGVPGVAA